MIISFQTKFSTHIKNLHLISVIRKFCVENGGLAVDFLMFTGCEINFDFLWLSDLALINRNLASCDVSLRHRTTLLGFSSEEIFNFNLMRYCISQTFPVKKGRNSFM